MFFGCWSKFLVFSMFFWCLVQVLGFFKVFFVFGPNFCLFSMFFGVSLFFWFFVGIFYFFKVFFALCFKFSVVGSFQIEGLPFNQALSSDSFFNRTILLNTSHPFQSNSSSFNKTLLLQPTCFFNQTINSSFSIKPFLNCYLFKDFFFWYISSLLVSFLHLDIQPF